MPSYAECLVEAELRARAAYAEPGREYHDLHHLDHCLALLEAVPELSESDKRLLRWAILWHDAVYEPERSDNEERSAKLARSELLACGIGQEEADEVARLIRLTKGHRAEAGDLPGALLVSIDLAILGSEPDRYRAYAQAVRREYAHLSEDEWRSGRAGVLKRLLAADPLYPDPWFAARFEARARRNMEEEFRALASG